MATDLSRITTEVEETRTVIDGAVALINNLAELLRDAVGAPDVTAAVNELADSLDAKQAELAAAIEANTPAEPERPAGVKLFKAEPAVFVSLVSAVIALAVSFGVDLTSNQVGAIMAVVTILAGLLVRSQVTPAP